MVRYSCPGPVVSPAVKPLATRLSFPPPLHGGERVIGDDSPNTGPRGLPLAWRINMCGIIGYVGRKEAEPILVEGLRRLEYRGYDSAGLATLTGRKLHLRKRAGRIAGLADYLRGHPAPGCHGISHTR